MLVKLTPDLLFSVSNDFYVSYFSGFFLIDFESAIESSLTRSYFFCLNSEKKLKKKVWKKISWLKVKLSVWTNSRMRAEGHLLVILNILKLF